MIPLSTSTIPVDLSNARTRLSFVMSSIIEPLANCCAPIACRPPAMEIACPDSAARPSARRMSVTDAIGTISLTRVGLSCEWMSFTTMPAASGARWTGRTGARAIRPAVFRKVLRSSAIMSSVCVPQATAALVKQPHGAHLHDVHQVVVIEVRVNPNAALLDQSGSDRNKNSARQIRAMAGNTADQVCRKQHQRKQQCRAVLENHVDELVVPKHPQRIKNKFEGSEDRERMAGPSSAGGRDH